MGIVNQETKTKPVCNFSVARRVFCGCGLEVVHCTFLLTGMFLAVVLGLTFWLSTPSFAGGGGGGGPAPAVKITKIGDIDDKSRDRVAGIESPAVPTTVGGDIGVQTEHSGAEDVVIDNQFRIRGGSWVKGGGSRLADAEVDKTFGVSAIHAGSGVLEVRSRSGSDIRVAGTGIHVRHDGSGVARFSLYEGGSIFTERGRGIFVGRGGNSNGDVIVDVGGKIRGWKEGIFVDHNGEGNVYINIGRTGSIWSEWNAIHVDHANGGERPNGGVIRIDVSGSVESNSRHAIYMASGGDKTLVLRPGFSLSSVRGTGVDAISSGGGTGILKLGPHTTDASREGTMNLDNFQGFKEFHKTDSATWTVTGGLAKTNGAFNNVFNKVAIGGGTLRLSGANFVMRDRGSLVIGHDTTLEITGESKLTGSLGNRGDIRFMSKGEDDSLTVSGDYRGSGDVIFYIDGTMNDENKMSLAWDTDKLMIESRIRGIARRDVIIVTPEGEKDASPLMINPPVLIEVHGKARANAFEGNQDLDDSRNFGIKYKSETAKDGNGRDYDVHQWYFAYKGPSSTVGTVMETAKTMSDDIEGELMPPDNRREGDFMGSPSFLADVRKHTGGPWATQQSFRISREPGGIANSRSRTQSNRIHFGYDIPAVNFMGGDMVVGASMSQGFSASDVFSPTGNGGTGLESHAAGLTAFWDSLDGFYAGGQTRYARFSNDISVGNRALVSDNKGTGVSSSVKAGYRFDVPLGGMDFGIAPQMRLVWSRVDFDDFIGLQGGLISLEDGDLVSGRLSLLWDGEWQGIGGSGRVYGGVNLRDALDNGTAVNVSGVSFAVRRGLSVDGRLGVSYEWDEGYAVHGEAVALRRGNAEEVRANLGVRIDF